MTLSPEPAVVGAYDMKELRYGETSIYVVDEHHHVLVPWFRHRWMTEGPLHVISFDHHMDTRRPFQKYAAMATGGQFEAARKIEYQRLSEVDAHDEASVVRALDNLAHDEHIWTATALGIVDAAFIISFDAREDLRVCSKADVTPLQNPPPIYVAGHPRWDSNFNGDEEAERLGWMEACDAALDTRALAPQFEVLNRMAQRNEAADYRKPGRFILDVDLDYFHTSKSMAPSDSTLFDELVRGAVAITVAREPKCVKDLALDPGLSADSLEAELLARIRSVLGAEPD